MRKPPNKAAQQYPNNAYSYIIDLDKWSFQDYGTEQQASIIEHYAAHFLSQDRKRHFINTYGDATESYQQSVLGIEHSYADLITLVENQFPNTKEARLAFWNLPRNRALTDEAPRHRNTRPPLPPPIKLRRFSCAHKTRFKDLAILFV